MKIRIRNFASLWCVFFFLIKGEWTELKRASYINGGCRDESRRWQSKTLWQLISGSLLLDGLYTKIVNAYTLCIWTSSVHVHSTCNIWHFPYRLHLRKKTQFDVILVPSQCNTSVRLQYKLQLQNVTNKSGTHNAKHGTARYVTHDHCRFLGIPTYLLAWD